VCTHTVPKNSASDKYVIDTTRLVAQFTTTLTDMAEPRCFSGKISDGITHPIGPKLILLSNQRESAKLARVCACACVCVRHRFTHLYEPKNTIIHTTASQPACAMIAGTRNTIPMPTKLAIITVTPTRSNGRLPKCSICSYVSHHAVSFQYKPNNSKDPLGARTQPVKRARTCHTLTTVMASLSNPTSVVLKVAMWSE